MGTILHLQAAKGTLYTATALESLPEVDDLTPPAYTVTPGGDWVVVGFTDEANHEFECVVEWEQTKVMENLSTVRITCISEGAIFRCKFLETDVIQMHNAISSRGTLTETTAAENQTAQEVLKFGDKTTTTEKSLLYKAESPEGGTRLIYFPYAVATGGLMVPMGKSPKPYDVEFTGRCNTSGTAGERLLKVIDILAPATG